MAFEVVVEHLSASSLYHRPQAVRPCGAPCGECDRLPLHPKLKGDILQVLRAPWL